MGTLRVTSRGCTLMLILLALATIPVNGDYQCDGKSPYESRCAQTYRFKHPKKEMKGCDNRRCWKLLCPTETACTAVKMGKNRFCCRSCKVQFCIRYGDRT